MVERVLTAYSRAHPQAARPGVADLSRPNGGSFGAEYGGLGHRSHQNGLDVDVLYPRTDLCECAPEVPADVDRRLAQDLLNRFVAEGVQYVFTGPSLGLRGPRGVVIPLRYHDDHMHVRIYPARTAPQPGRTPAAPVDGDGPAPTGGLKASAGSARHRHASGRCSPRRGVRIASRWMPRCASVDGCARPAPPPSVRPTFPGDAVERR